MTTFVLFGGTGDLAKRKLIPALYSAFVNGRLDHDFQFVGAARERLSDDEYRSRVGDSIAQYADKLSGASAETLQQFLALTRYAKIDARVPEDFAALKSMVHTSPTNATLFYLATGPDIFIPVVEQLSQHGLVEGNARVVVEKPLGRDAVSAKEINQSLRNYLEENQIYRIDHYLGKEMVQNLLALRFANSFLEPLWNRTWIQDVQISISEQVGVESRGDFYDHTGALRDMVQNHLLQLVSIVAMEPPVNANPDAIRDEKVKVLRALHKFSPDEVSKRTVRGQYRAGAVNGQPVIAYQAEPGVPPASRTETFVAIRAEINNWRWAGVPFYLRTGKRMASRSAEITINFKPIPYSIFGQSQGPMRSNRLVISLQPEESVQLFMKAKDPGEGIRLSDVALNLDFAEASNSRRVESYERLLLDAMHGDLTLFVRDDELSAAWAWIDPIMEAWKNDSEGLKSYIAGSWGPSASSYLLAQNNAAWGEEFVES
ncbi:MULTISPECIES: glucose-6-phosphate dehydrogenase [unclassified Undibacterium]|uniref:glucose-6-phosphate dehydrogenase n=1 Tax=unclassified Undibacterium TaxID=2630295 RepID=UPI002AC8E3AE|nr:MULTISPECIES: glucose-6-phosphate dehydrogenase [unclassified Undibacterium]MEB0139173.1 glucose-6-phosphate dehydrogenase [Undibacterium sp. CCC2.1]MEB0172252.1 glucose-6-phosphate dehydrogenase [Undibacterium sp. CCC1.1]MEB0175891.1 glucose-6-phosphate dehydrogenase [Undibacterium sp. CCC3.4]MEB0215249.1 glucose-6-phosphate dehydrogenase [Undibacterium sp. 5I2]WPX43547.1 glucose-6-phosphate dehydrogenase [Undibacterium sp. CCC3.4]